MANMLIVHEDGSITGDATESAVIRAYRDDGEIVWIDFDDSADTAPLEQWSELFGFGEPALEHLTRRHRGPRAVRFRTCMLIVIFDMSLGDGATMIEQNELVALAGDRYLLTIHSGANPHISRLASRLPASVHRFGIETGAVAFPLLDSISDSYLQIVEQVRIRVDTLEDQVLNQDEPDGISHLHLLRRQLTILRRTIAAEEALIGNPASPASFAMSPAVQDALLDIKHTMQRSLDDIDLYLGILPDILSTFEALKSDNLNRIVKLLTVWSIILTAVALFPTVMGISLAREPSISPYLGYAISSVTMVLVGWLIWYAFKRHGWIE